MRKKIVEFVQVHGYTYKSFALSTVLCPPAAVFIAFKMPGIGVARRIVLGVVGLIAAPVLTAVALYAVGQIVGLVRLHS
jgi:hypothetical protein